MLFHSIVSLSTSIFLPFLIAPFSDSPATYASNFRTTSPLAWSKWRSHLPTIPFAWLSLSLLWTLSNGLFSFLLLSTWFASSVGSASLIIAATGFSWAVTNWAPFALVRTIINSYFLDEIADFYFFRFKVGRSNITYRSIIVDYVRW